MAKSSLLVSTSNKTTSVVEPMEQEPYRQHALQHFFDFLVPREHPFDRITLKLEGKDGQPTLGITTYPIKTVEKIPL
ncbi:MAG: hypothetical protein LZF86_140076 [Nitrospira sp.]|nr:MAG: hypothetical protein LZF86_140076 [Nitrospira sp.]